MSISRLLDGFDTIREGKLRNIERINLVVPGFVDLLIQRLPVLTFAAWVAQCAQGVRLGNQKVGMIDSGVPMKIGRETDMDFGNLEWLFPVVIALHNAEEAIWFPAWSLGAGRWYPPVAPRLVRFGVTVLTVLAFVVTWLSARSGRQTVWTYLAFGYMVAMLANVIPHIAASVATRSYTPGVVTAVVLNLPLLSLLVILALRNGYVSGWMAVAYSVAVPGLLLLSILVLFKLGKILA